MNPSDLSSSSSKSNSPAGAIPLLLQTLSSRRQRPMYTPRRNGHTETKKDRSIPTETTRVIYTAVAKRGRGAAYHMYSAMIFSVESERSRLRRSVRSAMAGREEEDWSRGWRKEGKGLGCASSCEGKGRSGRGRLYSSLHDDPNGRDAATCSSSSCTYVSVYRRYTVYVYVRARRKNTRERDIQFLLSFFLFLCFVYGVPGIK